MPNKKKVRKIKFARTTGLAILVTILTFAFFGVYISQLILNPSFNANLQSDASGVKTTRFNKALNLIDDSGYIILNNSVGIEHRNDYTFELWLKPNETDTNGQYAVVLTKDTSSDPSFQADTGYNLSWRSDRWYQDVYHLYVRFNYASAFYSSCQPNSVYEGNIRLKSSELMGWHHLAVVFRPSDHRVIMYRNGQEMQGSYVLQDWQCRTDTSPLVIGKRPGLTTKRFNGQIDEFRLSDIARYTSAFEPPIQQFIPDVNTLLLYNFNVSTQTTVLPDLSGNHRDAQIIGKVDFVTSNITLP